MEYQRVNKSGKYYYKGEDGKLYGEGYDEVEDFGSNGLAVVRKADGKWYYINEKFETVSEGYKNAEDFNEFKGFFIENLLIDVMPYSLTKISESKVAVADLDKYRAKFLANILKTRRIK